MDARIYRPVPMGLADALLDLQLADRLSYDAERNTLFANFEGMAIRTPEDVESVRRVFDTLCTGIGRKRGDDRQLRRLPARRVDRATPISTWSASCTPSTTARATRYTTSAFMRMKLGASLPMRNASAQVFETRAEAMAFSERQAGGEGLGSG